MRRSDELNWEIKERFSELAEENKAAIIGTLVEYLSEQAVISSDRQLKSGANP